MLDKGEYIHSDYGKVTIDEHCIWLQENNDNKGSIFVRRYGEIIEVAKRLLRPIDGNDD